MRLRRHHNNKGYRQIKRGKTHKSLQRIVQRINPMKGIIKNVKQLASSDGNVWKYIFEFDGAITEAVLYKYGSFEQRTVLCISVQSGCPVGCTFCGTGENFLRNLTAKEIMARKEKKDDRWCSDFKEFLAEELVVPSSFSKRPSGKDKRAQRIANKRRDKISVY